jgi:O-palmitoleoyl-L-serine hydrolase
MKAIFHLALSAAFLLAVSEAVTPVPRTNLTDPSARCMDGTLGAYYHRPAEQPESRDKWILFLEGGGECTTASNCANAVNSTLGSNKYFPATQWLYYFLVDDPVANPDFYGYNHVLLKYCSQDLWSGQVTKPSDGTFGYYFSGHLIFKAVVAALMEKGMSNASEIILSGASAGGIGTWINADWLKEQFSASPSPPRVTIASIAGFYFYAYPYQGVNHTQSDLADFRPQAWPRTYQLWQSFADESCVAAIPSTPWACLLSNYSHPYVSTPAFIFEAQTDEVVTTAHDWLPYDYRHYPPEQAYLGEWQANMTQALSFVLDAPQGQSNYGVFFPSCFIHTDFNNTNPIIGGLSYLDAFSNWYFSRDGPTRLADDCGVTCNPTCQH